MATTMTLEPIPKTGTRDDTLKLTVAWLGDASGDASASTDDFNFIGQKITDVIKGRSLFYCQTVPGTVDETYDVTVTDANSQDLFGGGMSGRSATATESEFAYDGAAYGSFAISSALTITIASAGNAKTGSAILYLS